MSKTLPFLFIYFFFISHDTYAQRVITGKVVSAEDNTEIPGVNVLVKNTSVGTTTDVDGSFTLEVPTDANTLVFSFVGFKTLESEIGNRSNIVVSLEPDVTELEELVVTGYSSRQKRDVIGSIVSVTPEDLKDLPIGSIDQALQGQAAGVQVNQSSGTPGGGITVRIRGNTSISASNRPLYIIDGVPVDVGSLSGRDFGGQNDNALALFNPNDIESIQVLKDASSKAIYGSRAANGVVLITTKRGKAGRTKFNVEVQRGLVDLIKLPNLLNASELLELQQEAVSNAGEETDDRGLISGVTDGVDTDWMDEILRTGIMQQYQFSAAGGDEINRFYLGLSYRDEEGVQINNRFRRFSGTLNLDHQANDKFNIATNLTISRSKNDRVKGDNFLDGVYSGAIKSLPYFYPYNEQGAIIGPGSENYPGFPNFNPVGQAILPRFETIGTKILAGVKGEYIITPQLRFSSKVSVDYTNVQEDQFEPSSTAIGGFLPNVGGQGYGVNSFNESSTIINTNILTYNFRLGESNFSTLVGTEFIKAQGRSNNVQGRLFPSDDFTYITSAGVVDNGSSFRIENALESYFTQLEFDFKDRYLAALTARYDGSSRFGPGKRFGFFPSISAGWRLSSEPFMQNIGLIDDLKLRASFGYTGNERIGNFAFLGTWSTSTYSGLSGLAPANIGNEDLQWESTREINIGVDFSVQGGKYQGQIDFYSNLTSNLLFNEPQPLTTGFGAIQGNIGEISNKGVEVSFTSVNIDTDLTWSTNFNVSRNLNNVEFLVDSLPLFRGYTANGAGFTNVVLEGQPLGTFWGLNFQGVDPATGNAIYEDANNDGSITPDDAMVIGNAQPDFIGGITNKFNYKGFDLNVFFQFSYGNEMLNFSNVTLLDAGEDLNNNQVREALDRWQEPGDITSVPRYEAGNTFNNRHSSRFLEDGSFLRLKNISLGYNLPSRLTQRLGMDNVRVYASGTNLWTLTSYSGPDPEVSTLDGSTTAQAIDFFTLPQVKTMMLGLNIAF